ncbi:unnamed protein product [Wickerhamomyces anomalus]
MAGFIVDEVKFWKKNKKTIKLDEEEQSIEEVDTTKQPPNKLQNFLPDHEGKPWYKVPHLLYLNMLMVIISISSANTGYDGSLLNAFQSIPDWMRAMSNPTGATLGALSNGVVFGVALGFFVTSYVSDRFGRRNTITIGNAFMFGGSVVQSCAGTWLTVSGERDHDDGMRTYAMFLIARIIIGFGNSMTMVASPSLISELSYPTHREVVTAFYNSNWYLGAIVSSWCSYGTRNLSSNWSWRVPTILQGFFPLIQFFLIYLVPESPRFLVSKGRNDEARDILLKHHGGGDESKGGALVDFELAEIEMAIEEEKLADKSSYLDFFKTPGNRKRLWILVWIAILMQLSGNGLVSYYLNKVLVSIGINNTDEQLLFTGGLMIYNYVISIFINLFAFQHTKRRPMFIISVSLMLLFYVIWTILSAINQQRNFEDKALGKGVLAMIFLYYFAYNLGLNGLPYLYMTEITSYQIRAKGININVFGQELGQIYNNFVNPIAMDAIEWKYYIVWCCILAVELIVVILTFVETSGRTLEEVAEVFDEKIENFDMKLIKEKAQISHAEHVDNSNDGSSVTDKSTGLMV